MKKLLFTAFVLGGFTLGFSAETKTNEKTEQKEKKVAKYYNPVRLESSCGYVQYITLTSQDNAACLLVELADMEDFCNAGVDGEWLV